MSGILRNIRSRSQSRERRDHLAALLPGVEEQTPHHGLQEQSEQHEQELPRRDHRSDYRDHHRQDEESVDGSEVEEWRTGLDHPCDPTMAFTKSHPIGSLLLKMQTDITKLAVLNKMRSMESNVKEICDEFHNGISLERANTCNTIAVNNSSIKEELTAKELQAHRLENPIDPPKNFAPNPQLVDNPAKLAECFKVFPRGHKFSGSNKEGHMNVREFLTNLNLAQEQCRLSEQEFLARMLASSTAGAHELIQMWIDNGNNVAQIYESLLIHYDKRPSAEEAKASLFSYKVARNEDLAKAEAKIMIWVGTAAKAIPAGPSRVQYTNLEGCQALIRALPDWSKINVSNLYESLSAKLGRTLTFTELHQALHALRPNIDKDIKQNGIDSQRPPRFNNKSPQIKYSSYNMNVKEGIDTVERRVFPPRRSNTETSFTPRPAYRPPMRRTNNNRTRGSFANTNRGANNNTNKNAGNFGGAFNKFNTGPERGRTNMTSNNVSNKNNNNYNRKGRGFSNYNRNKNDAASCLLCGYKNHKAENCRNMKDDNGNIKGVIPGFGTCSKCPKEIQPRLNHPESLCPFRPKGPLYKKVPT